MKPYLQIAGFWAAMLLGVWIYVNADVPQPRGVIAPDEPRQVDIVERSWTRGDARFTALAEFDLRARVLSTSHYLFDAGSDLAPVNLALGWGRMSDSDVLEGIRISQGGRFYYWRVPAGHPAPIPIAEIISHSANMHMIPAGKGVEKALLDVRKGEIVTLSGYLVEVNRPHGWKWRSSLSRTDTGAGACELVWVERLSATGTAPMP